MKIKFPTLFLPMILDWAFSNTDGVLDAVIPHVAKALKLKPNAERTLRIVVPALIEGAKDIHESSPDFQTKEGALAVLAEIKDFIDETGDEWPLWSGWSEGERDAFLVHTFISMSGFVPGSSKTPSSGMSPSERRTSRRPFARPSTLLERQLARDSRPKKSGRPESPRSTRSSFSEQIFVRLLPRRLPW